MVARKRTKNYDDDDDDGDDDDDDDDDGNGDDDDGNDGDDGDDDVLTPITKYFLRWFRICLRSVVRWRDEGRQFHNRYRSYHSMISHVLRGAVK